MCVVKLSQVTKSYTLGKSTVHALRGLDLEVEQGEFLVVKGHSGSGKSTALNMIGVMDLPSSGEVTIVGKNVAQLSDYQQSMLRRNHIGFIFQSFNLIPVLSALENVEYPLYLKGVPQRRKKAKDFLAQVGLEKFMSHRPNELSGGQRQRVAIARALVTEPDVLLADEPTANLDSKTSEQILKLMFSLQKEYNITFIVSTHHALIMEHASRIIELQDGAITSPEASRISA
ncbi:MAG: lipoprotein-releasing system ATP-binding protein LolD [SAR324 cluster bacterium]|uniref:Lipoprotein-releasing system ATP-binding protein LolD n=1 Tax=SAR324 cluster bacterium TaxID=2024889 RepID=A0A2A4T4E3_9DELT|nr:MAG: lipoprotein-releasing system ATP-binding protein LolD [SAR324 cluster bacterium]